jgi:DNA-binding MarR family transcriptional regulator
MEKTEQNADAGNSLELDEFVCFAVYTTSHAFNRVYKPLLDALRLTYPQYLTMALLWRRDGQTVGNLSEKLLLESSTLTPLLKRLEALGVLRRSRDPEDERQVRVYLTDEGRALREKARSIPPCIQEASGMTPEEVHELRGKLVALRHGLERSVSTGSS